MDDLPSRRSCTAASQSWRSPSHEVKQWRPRRDSNSRSRLESQRTMIGMIGIEKPRSDPFEVGRCTSWPFSVLVFNLCQTGGCHLGPTNGGSWLSDLYSMSAMVSHVSRASAPRGDARTTPLSPKVPVSGVPSPSTPVPIRKVELSESNRAALSCRVSTGGSPPSRRARADPLERRSWDPTASSKH